jgi:hypothetical protein
MDFAGAELAKRRRELEGEQVTEGQLG